MNLNDWKRLQSDRVESARFGESPVRLNREDKQQIASETGTQYGIVGCHPGSEKPIRDYDYEEPNYDRDIFDPKLKTFGRMRNEDAIADNKAYFDRLARDRHSAALRCQQLRDTMQNKRRGEQEYNNAAQAFRIEWRVNWWDELAGGETNG